MKTIKIIFNKDGSMQPVAIDFKLCRGEYNQVELLVQIPKNLLLGKVVDEVGNILTGNIVKVGAIIHKANGQVYTTQDYNIPLQQEQEIDGMKYAIYSRRLPKEFTLWETVATELGQKGELQMVINLLSTRQENDKTVVESILTSPIIVMSIYASAYLADETSIEVNKVEGLIALVGGLQSTVQQDMATKIELEKIESNKIDKLLAEENKLLLSNGYGGIKASSVGIQEYENQKEYIDRLHNNQEDAIQELRGEHSARMDGMQQEISANTKDRHTHQNERLLNSYTVENSDLEANTQARHEHSNMSILEGMTEAFTKELKYNLEGAIADVNFNAETGEFIFIKNNGDPVKIDTLLEKVIVNFNYDKNKQALILECEDGTMQEIPIGALLSPYQGSEGTEIAVTVNRDNEIEANIKEGAVTEQKLAIDIVNKLSEIVPKREIIDLIYPIGITIEFAEEVDPNTIWTWTKWTRITNRRFALPVEEGKVGDMGGSETHTLTVAELAPHNHTQDEHNHYLDLPRKWGFNPAGDQNWLGWAGGDRGGENRQRYSNGVRPNIHNTGGGRAFSIMNPYVGVAKWKRVTKEEYDRVNNNS